VAARWIDGDELRRLAPVVSDEIQTALHIPGEAVVEPSALSRALRASLLVLGVEVRDEEAVRVHLDGDPLVELAGGDRVTGSIVIVAAGAWAPEVVGAGVAQVVPVRPIRGQAVEVRSAWSEGPSLRFPSERLGRDYHVVARGGGAAWIGSTVEDVGFEASVTESGIAELLEAASEVLSRPPTRSDVVRAWTGLRPKAMRPGGPFLGRIPGAENAWVAAGHYRSGMLLGPLSARLLVHALHGDEDALRREGFDPESFRTFAPR
jgi:glycine oxidase